MICLDGWLILPFLSVVAFVVAGRVESFRNPCICGDYPSHGCCHIAFSNPQATSPGIWFNLSFREFDCVDPVEADSIAKTWFTDDITWRRTNWATYLQQLCPLLFSTIIYCRRNLDLSKPGSFWPRWRVFFFVIDRTFLVINQIH